MEEHCEEMNRDAVILNGMIRASLTKVTFEQI